jgi:NAD(P)-dependent dehydrogenase (short-subunit alcohol dehydrogenase family)
LLEQRDFGPHLLAPGAQDERVALVTGANQGIGLQIAKELAAKRFTVMIGSRDLARGV